MYAKVLSENIDDIQNSRSVLVIIPEEMSWDELNSMRYLFKELKEDGIEATYYDYDNPERETEGTIKIPLFNKFVKSQ